MKIKGNSLKKLKLISTGFAALFVLAALFLAPANAALQAVSPAKNPVNGFPLWYQDMNGMTIELCSDPANPLCVADPVIPGNNFSAQIGLGGEAFWWSADAGLNIPAGGALPTGGRAILVLAMEAAFATLVPAGEPAPGQQISFGRVRIRIDAPVAGTYTVTHPFGVETFTVTTPGIRAISDATNPPTAGTGLTGDIGCEVVPCDFSLALGSGIGPFLRWDTGFPVVDADGRKYLGDAATPHTVTGSPINKNFFRVQGPNGSNLGGAGVDFIETNLFTISGKIADTIPPVFLGNSTAPSPVESGRDSFSLSASITDPIDPAFNISSGVANMTVDLRQLSVPNASMALAIGTGANGTWSVTLSPVSRIIGTFMLPVTGRDGSFNVNTSNILLTIVDTIPPTVVLSDNHPDNIVRDADTVLITANFTEIGSGINETNPPKITIGTAVTAAVMTRVNNTVWNFTWDVTAGSDGIADVTISAVDMAGNTNTAATGKISYIIDNILPEFVSTTPATVEAAFNSSVISANVADLNGVKSVAVNLSTIGMFTANLQGSQEVPPTNSTATGNGTFVINTDANTLSFDIQFGGLSGTEIGAHIHGPAPPGVATGILFTLPPGSPKVGVWNYSEAQEANITEGLTYVNIHSPAFTGGEIRGQILPVVNMTLASGTINNGVWQVAVRSAKTGIFNLPLDATDIAGNSNATGTVTLTVIDTKPPVISLTQAVPDSIIPDGADTTTLIVNVSDFGIVSAITSVIADLSQIGGSNTSAFINTGGSTWQSSGVTTNMLNLGGTTVRLPVNATDSAGNSNISASISLGIKKFIPLSAGNTTPFNFVTDTGAIITNASITVPSGTTLTGQLLGAPVVSPPALLGLKLAGVAINLTNLTFNRPVRLGMEFNPATFGDPANESKIRVWFFNTTTGKWEMTANSVVDVQNRTVSGDAARVGTFAPLADIVPPVISNIANTSITASSAMINWMTDEFSQSSVNFGTASGVYTNTTNVSSGISHSVQLTRLSINTSYFYTVNSMDLTGNSATSEEKSFTTLASRFEPQVAVYDRNGNNIIEKAEAVVAVLDFFNGAIPKPTAVAVVLAFFGG